MSTSWTEADMAAYAARHGLTALSPENLTHMTRLAEIVARTGRELARVASEFDEPAPTLRLPFR